MKYILVKLLLVSCLLSLASPVLGAEIESVKIGWDNNYRIGYWCPVRVELKTDNQYDGELVFKVDNVTYIHPVTIPISSTKVIDFNIVINSEYPDIDIKLSGQDKGFVLPQLKSIPTNEVLIGIEENIYKQNQEYLKKWTQHWHFSLFNLSDLPLNGHGSYEIIDLLIIPKDTIINSLEGSITDCVRVKYCDKELLTDTLSPIAIRPRLEEPCMQPGLYEEFNASPWHDNIKKALLGYILICALIYIIIILLFIWIRMKRQSYAVFLGGLIFGVAIAIILMYGIYLPFECTMDFNIVGERTLASEIAIGLLNGRRDAVQQDHSVMVYNQFSPEGPAVKFSSPYYKPIYKEQADEPLLIIRFNTNGRIGVEMPLGTRMVYLNTRIWTRND